MESADDTAPLVEQSVVVAPTRYKHWPHLDGIRGLAALWVVIHHAWAEVADAMTPGFRKATAFFGHGEIGVAIFIVLSGYCLMLPVVQSRDLALRGGVLGYLLRRGRRILPPYYAAVITCLLLIVFVPGMGRPTGARWDMCLPAFTPNVLASHLFLVHDWTPAWSNKIDYPLWSVAVEWHIYFVFALLLLPLWRRLGAWAALVAALVVGGVPHFLGDHVTQLATPWMLVLFALGMMGASVGSGAPRALPLSLNLPWGTAAMALVGFYAVALALDKTALFRVNYLNDVYIGCTTVCLLVYCARQQGLAERTKHKSRALRIMGSRVAVQLGLFSYSLYLIHAPVLSLVYLVLRRGDVSPAAMLGVMWAVGVPLALVGGYGFYRLFEEPCLRAKRKKEGAQPI